MKVYPNPVESDVLMFDFSGMSGPRTLEVMDIHGDVVIKLGPDRLKNNEVIRIETGHWRSGMYVIRARAGREMVVEKIIVN